MEEDMGFVLMPRPTELKADSVAGEGGVEV